MNQIIPNSMQAVLLEEFGKPPTVRQIPVPKPGPGEVLVRMAASPINPSDLGFMKGGYSIKKSFPVVPGFEGSGTVVAAGPGLLPRLWIGKRVACAVSGTGGTWAEYVVTRAMLCVPLQKNLSLEQGAMMLVNPMSALAFFDIAKSEKHEAIVNTAAASALGRMIFRLGRRYHVPVINVVRRKEQVDLLRSLGAEFVLQSNDANFSNDFRILAQRLKATLILDAVGGKLARLMLEIAPSGTTLLLYANLSGEELVLDPHGLGSEKKRIAGFYLGNWVEKRDIFQSLRDIRRVQQLGATDLQSTIQKRLPLSAVQQAVEIYQNNMTAGKILLVADPGKVRVDE
jgi:NADPH2:quinone reductase